MLPLQHFLRTLHIGSVLLAKLNEHARVLSGFRNPATPPPMTRTRFSALRRTDSRGRIIRAFATPADIIRTAFSVA
jgi:hypothetical protein